MTGQQAHRSRRRVLRDSVGGTIGSLLLSGCFSNESATPPEVQWNETFGGQNGDSAASIIQTTDDGFLFAGNTRSFVDGDENAWLVKLDAEGCEDWHTSIGGEGKDIASSVIETEDGNYLFVGSTWSFADENADALVGKVSANGSEVWHHTFGGDWTDHAHSVINTTDGGFLFAGSTRSFGDTGVDAWIVKLDAEGSEEWSELFSEGRDQDSAASVIETSDGGYLFTGSTRNLGEEVPSDAWVVKLDANGTEEWRETFGDGDSSASTVIESNDNGYVVVGRKRPVSLLDWFADGGAWVLKLDANGAEEWSETFGGEFLEQDIASSVINTTDGGYLFAGGTRSFTDEGVDAWLVQLTADGSEMWQDTIGDEGRDTANSVIETNDGSYLFAGQTESVGDANWDAWVVKLAG